MHTAQVYSTLCGSTNEIDINTTNNTDADSSVFMIRPVTVTRKSFLIDSLSMSTDSLQESVNNLVDGPGKWQWLFEIGKCKCLQDEYGKLAC